MLSAAIVIDALKVKAETAIYKPDLAWTLFFLAFLAHLSWKLKVSFCDHSPSVVVVIVVRMSVRPSVRPSVHNL